MDRMRSSGLHPKDSLHIGEIGTEWSRDMFQSPVDAEEVNNGEAYGQSQDDMGKRHSPRVVRMPGEVHDFDLDLWRLMASFWTRLTVLRVWQDGLGLKCLSNGKAIQGVILLCDFLLIGSMANRSLGDLGRGLGGQSQLEWHRVCLCGLSRVGRNQVAK